MATFIQKKQNVNDANDTSLTVTLDAPTTAGSLLLAWVKWEGLNDFDGVADATASVVEGAGGFTAATGQGYTAIDLNGQWFYKLVAAGSDTTIVATWSAARAFKSMHVYEYSYSGTASFGTEIATAEATSGSVATGNITTGADAAVVACGVALYSGETVSAGTADINGVDADQALTPASSQSHQSWVRNTGTLNFTGQGTGTVSGTPLWLANLISINVVAGGGAGGPLVNGGSITRGSLIRGGRIVG